jgi:hypothetical protein
MDLPGYLDAVKALIEVGGVRVNEQDDSWASGSFLGRNGRVCRDCGISPNRPRYWGKFRDNDGRTPVSYTASNGRLDVVKILTISGTVLTFAYQIHWAGHLRAGQY